MTIKVGDRLPSMKVISAGSNGPTELSTDEIFKGRKAVLFGVPGAFTPTCSAKHLPGFVDNAAALKGKGIEVIACMAVNDVFVLTAWSKSQGLDGEILMIADGSGLLTRALGLELDLTQRGLGIRSQRFALVADDMKVTKLAVEPPGEFGVSTAEAVLESL